MRRHKAQESDWTFSSDVLLHENYAMYDPAYS